MIARARVSSPCKRLCIHHPPMMTTTQQNDDDEQEHAMTCDTGAGFSLFQAARFSAAFEAILVQDFS